MTSQEVSQTSKKPQGFFYGYFIVIVAFFIMLVGYGLYTVFGVFFDPLIREFGWSRATTSGAFSVSMILSGVLGILMGGINDRFGPRIVLTVCACFLGIGFLLLVSLVLNAWIAAMRIAVPRAATFMMSYLVIAVLFAALYKVVPDVTLKWSDVALGAMITSLLFMIGKQFMGLYFAHTSYGSMYSAAASPIVVLLWVYYSAQLLFWGAEFSKVYTRTMGSQRDRQC